MVVKAANEMSGYIAHRNTVGLNRFLLRVLRSLLTVVLKMEKFKITNKDDRKMASVMKGVRSGGGIKKVN